jgi:multidrug efflux pump subunit AcrB
MSKKSFFLSTASVNNRKTVFVVTFMIVLFGIIAYTSMPKAAFPDIVLPQIYVGTPYPGNSPADIEKLITRPLEKEIKAVSEVDKITSTSIQGYSTILVEFDFSMSPAEALQKVKDAVDRAKGDPSFPNDLPMEPNIFEMNFSEMPILNVNLSGDFSIDQLKKYGEILEDKIEDLPEISKVEIRGVQDKEVKIEVDLYKMESMEISFMDIENAVGYENMTISGGDILMGDMRRNIRVVGDFNSIEELENVIVKREKMQIVYLRDIADVKFEFEEPSSFAREFAKPVVMVDVIKKSGENLLAASEKINEIIEETKENQFPGNLEVSITNDQSTDIKNQVSNLENSIISGVILVVLVLLFFLGLRNALFVGIAIPLSMFMSFMILSTMGITINMIVLFALILALGMLVDNGIVVVENIYRLMKEEGLGAIEAARQGTGEVAWPIIASTATTLAAFLPLAFWPGMMGEFMGYLPITLIIVLGSSLFVGLVINPVFTAVFMKVENANTSNKKTIIYACIAIVVGILLLFAQAFSMGNLIIFFGAFTLLNLFILSPLADKFQTTLMPWLEEKYKAFLRVVLKGKRPTLMFASMFGLLIFSFVLMGIFPPKVEFFPVNMPKYVNIFIEQPIGTDINPVNETTKKIEQILIKELSVYNDTIETEKGIEVKNYLVKSMIAQVGAGTSDPAEGPAMGNTPHKARVQVSFVDYEFRRGILTNKVMEDIRDAVSGIPGLTITVSKDAAGPPVGLPISIEITGDDYDLLINQAEEMKSFINSKGIAGIEELKLDIDAQKPEVVINIDREKARALNLSTGQIGSTLRNALFGKEVSQYKDGEDDFPIQVRLADKYRYDFESLMNQKITFRDQTNGQIRQIPISAVASAKNVSSYSAVKRKNLTRIITLGSNVKEGYNPTEVVDKIKAELKTYELPKGVDFKFGGQQEEQAKEMAFLSSALMMAMFFIFLIIVTQFNSIGTPFIIVASIVFSLIGVLLGLVIFQMDFIIIMTMIGIISLAGVVVNNAIVLIDYTNLIMERRKTELGLSEEEKLPMNEVIQATIEGGKTRLRPVLLTAITTVLGLLPMATGMNINFFTLLSDFDPQIYFGGDNVVFWGPMSWTVIFGLTFATFLTLVIVPVMSLIRMKLKYRFG